jgi:hypothetical protein
MLWGGQDQHGAVVEVSAPRERSEDPRLYRSLSSVRGVSRVLCFSKLWCLKSPVLRLLLEQVCCDSAVNCCFMMRAAALPAWEGKR